MTSAELTPVLSFVMPHLEDADPRIGRVLQGRYRILAPLARGGMGVVYRGERVGLGRPVAIKFLRDLPAEHAELRRRFEIEARAASRMRHPNCVPVIDFGVDLDAPYLVMDYVAGTSLRTLLADEPLPVARTIAIARQVLAGLAHAHTRGIVHRDIKPENILVWSDAMGEHAQLADFGLAKMTDSLGTSANIALGSPSYMSPEQTLGHPVDARSDVYSAGILLFELLADRKPFRAKRPFDIMALHRDGPVPAFLDVAPERAISPLLERVVRKALAKAPADRYTSAVEMARALELAAALPADDDEPFVPLQSAWLGWTLMLVAAAMVAITVLLAV